LRVGLCTASPEAHCVFLATAVVLVKYVASTFTNEVIVLCCLVQVELMWQKFGAGIWEALSKRYTDIDMNEVSCPQSLTCIRAAILMQH
jgi:hypothetical protein